MSRQFARTISALLALGTAMATTGASAQQVEPRPTLRPVLRPSLQQVEVLPTEIIPPADVEPYDDPLSVTLRSGTSSDLIRSLAIRRTFSVENLKRNPEIQLGAMRVDMRPVLQNPDAPINMASQLRQQTAMVTDVRDTMEVVEAESGLIIRQYLAYRMLPGACSNRGRRGRFILTNSSCFTRMSEDERAAARSDPNSARYVSNAGSRLMSRSVIAGREAEAAQIASDLASLRTMLRDPAQRAEIEREIGVAETARFEAMNDEQLEAEIINTGEIQLEETMFVPSAEQLRPIYRQGPSLAVASVGTFERARPRFPQPVETVQADHTITDRTFLTGFTLGRSHEWRKRVSVTINWCVVSCKRTYYLEANAGFEYGFGLRLPIKVGGEYHYTRVGNNEHASFTAQLAPINGSTTDFTSTALPGEQLFDGQELVAEVGASAGFAYKVPAISPGSIGASVSLDLTESLPAPFTNGQFTPPAPGQASPPSADHVFRNIDLLGGRANFWFAGAKVHPAVKLGLTSDRLEMSLTDNLSGAEMHITQPGQTFNLSVDQTNHASSFTISDPIYNLGFTLTPGITAILFVDVKAWSKEWPWNIWFPQLTITLPPGGHDFGCHAETICSRSYNYSPEIQEEQAAQASAPSDPLEAMIWHWRREFLAEWQPRCPDEEIKFCEVAVNWVAQKYGYRMSEAIPEAYGQDVLNLDMLNAPEAQSMFATIDHQARGEANAIIEDSVARAAE